MMSADYSKYLATEILSVKRTLSYRNVSRAQKVHVNTAKCMLYEFYESQSRRKPGSLYATYLISGVKKQEKPANNGTTNGVYDEDEPMPSSPPPFTSSMMDPSQQESETGARQVPKKTITIVREEALEDVRAQYETISSTHIYSLSPTKLSDLVTLTDIGQGLYADVFAKEDPLLHNKTYGVIQNPEVRRRKGKRPVLPTAPPPKFQPVKEQPKPAQPASNPTSNLKKEETTSRPSSRDSTSTAAPKPAPLKRNASSSGAADLFKAFAKSQPPKLNPKNDSQDSKMSNTSQKLSDDEGESEDEALFLDNNTRKASKKRASDAKKEREDKAAKLRKMMDSDDEATTAALPKVEDEAAKASGPLATDKAPEGDDNEEGVAWSDSDSGGGKPEKDAMPDAEAVPEEMGPRRKRGKRKVMKKKTTKDDEGYLVTKEEACWESFSESDHEPEKKTVGSSQKGVFGKMQGSQKQSASQSQSASQKSAGAKGATKAKGDLRSFFGKK